MTTVNHVIVKARKKGKKKPLIVHDQKIAPAVNDKQILAALKQHYDVISLTIEDGVATAWIGKKVPDEAA